MRKFISFVIGVTFLVPGLAKGDNSIGHGYMEAIKEGAIISDPPKGEVSLFMRSGSAYYFSSFGIGITDYENIPGEIVLCDNGDVYVKDILSQSTFETYLKGYKDGDNVVFNLPQVIGEAVYDDNTVQFIATLMQYYKAENEEDSFYYEANSQQAINWGFLRLKISS